MAKHRTHSVEFKRQVSQEYLSGETLHGLSKRHNVSRNLIRIWVDKFQAGALERTSLPPICSRRTKRVSLRSSDWLASRLLNWSS